MEQMNEKSSAFSKERSHVDNTLSRHSNPAPRLSFKEAIGNAIANYATLKGRSRRSEFWWFSLFETLVMAVPLVGLGIVTYAFEGTFHHIDGFENSTEEALHGIGVMILLLISLFLFIPSLSVTVRRLHDTGRSGKWLLGCILVGGAYKSLSKLMLGSAVVNSMDRLELIKQAFTDLTIGNGVVLFLGVIDVALSIIMLVFLLQDSDKGENRYGPSPKYQ